MGMHGHGDIASVDKMNHQGIAHHSPELRPEDPPPLGLRQGRGIAAIGIADVAILGIDQGFASNPEPGLRIDQVFAGGGIVPIHPLHRYPIVALYSRLHGACCQQ
jgi:hypothetical protein